MSSKIVITIPNANVPEVKYVFNCLISEFLGFDYDLIVSEKKCCFKVSYNSNELEISNVFFKDDNIDNLYLTSNIPSGATFSELKFSNKYYPQTVIFGRSTYLKIENGFRWENDIVAATFFMLTRWEEKAVLKRDEHDRFMAADSLAYKNDFLHRAVINEYVEILHEILISFGFKHSRRQRLYNTIPTHDVDQAYLWNSGMRKIKSLGASLFLRRNKEEIKKRTLSLITKVDPYDTFDLLMDMADSTNVKATFYFMTGGETKFDNFYQIKEPLVINLLNKIKARNHIIGIHPSYNSYANIEILKKEIEVLESIVGTEIDSSRQHYLRFDVDRTLSNLNEMNIAWDSTICYADSSGFRSGVCYEYPTFDLNQRKQLTLREKPLIVMDTTLQKYENLSPEMALEKITNLQNEVKRYEGDFVFLWHNSSFNSEEWIGYEVVFESLYKQFKY